MHTLSIPFKIIKGQNILNHKRIAYSLMVRTAYSHLSANLQGRSQTNPLRGSQTNLQSKSQTNLLRRSYTEKVIKQTLKDHYQLRYGIESLSINSALLEAKSLVAQDKEFQKSHKNKQKHRLAYNQKIQKQRNDLKQKIQELLMTKHHKVSINKLKKQLKTLKPKKELPDYRLGHIVFGGKANLLAHQKRVNKLNEQIQFTQNNAHLTAEEKKNKVIELADLIQKSKQNWKDSRLRPLSICGETRKGGNRFFKISHDLKTCFLTFSRSSTGTKKGKTITETAELSLAKLNGKWNYILEELVRKANNNEITLFFRLNNNKLDITYDETVLTKPFSTKVQQSDSPKIKKLKTLNLLKRYPIFKHPESKIMTKIKDNRAIGIDLNPEWIGVSVIQFKHDETLNIHDTNQVFVLDYKLFKIDVKTHNKDSEYNKKNMAECLSNIAESVFKLVRYYNVNKIYLEDGLGKLKGKTKSRNLNGLLNYWGRSVFTRILERKARLTVCSDKVHVEYVWAGYSSIIGNMVDWQVLPKESCRDSFGKTCTSFIPDACSAGVEIARRGYAIYAVNSLVNSLTIYEVNSHVKSFKGKVELPLFNLRNLIVTKKDLLGLEQYDFCENGWGKLSAMLRRISKEAWREPGFIGYRNRHHSYFVKNGRVVADKVAEVHFNELTDVERNDPRVV